MHELGLEYEKEAEKIKRIIAARRDILKCDNKSATANELFEVKRELKCLYTQYRETVEIAEYLKNYYVPHTGRRELFSYK